MISLIKRKFYHIKNKIKEIIYKEEEYNTYFKNKSNILIKSFVNNDKILITHKNISNKEIILPINTPINFNIDDIEEEVNRFACIQEYQYFFNKHSKRRLVIYQNTNNLLLGLLDYLVCKKKYSKYHIFTGDIDSYNCNIYLEKKYDYVTLNTIEYDNDCMYRIIRNEWEDFYNTDKNKSDDIIIFFSKKSSIQEITRALQWIKNCYLSIPYNKFLIKLLQFIFRRELIIETEHVNYNYCILKVNYDNYKYMDTEKIINIFIKKCIEFKEKYFPILFPMYYNFPSSK